MPKIHSNINMQNASVCGCHVLLCTSPANRLQIDLRAAGPTKNGITSDAAICRKKRPRSRGSKKPSWVGADDSFERRIADVVEYFVNRRVQFYQLWTNAAQIMSDNNRDVEQVRLHSLQGQTRHMNKTIESVNFSDKKCNCTGDTHLHTSQLSLAIPYWIGTTGNSNGDSIVTA